MAEDIAMNKSYSELLKHPKWQERRLRIFERDGFRCRGCGTQEKTLHVHHLRYSWGKAPWEYPDELLKTLCETCHEGASIAQKRFKSVAEQLQGTGDLALIWTAIGFMQGLVAVATKRSAVRIERGEQASGIGSALEATEAEANQAIVGDSSTGWSVDVDRLWKARLSRRASESKQDGEPICSGPDLDQADHEEGEP